MKIKTIQNKIRILAAIPIAVFILFAFFFARSKWVELEVTDIMHHNSILVKAASIIITELQKERGQSNLFINGALSPSEIQDQRKKTDSALDEFRQALGEAAIANETRDTAVSGLSELPDLRAGVDKKLSMTESFENFTLLIKKIIATQTAAIKGKTSSGIGKRLSNIALFEDAKENAAKFRGLVSGLLAADQPLSETALNDMMEYHAHVTANLDSSALSIPEDMKLQIQGLMTGSDWTEVSTVFHKMISLMDKGGFGVDPKQFFSTGTRLVEAIQGLSDREMGWIEKEIETIKANTVSGISWNLGLLIAAIAVMLGSSIAIGRSIQRPVKSIAKALSEVSEEIVSASSQISSSGKVLADGASEQAAAIEETSSAMEEISSMTKQNAENAQRANEFMMEARNEVDGANAAMEKVTFSMGNISAASESTSKIIKTIDEIAFQTNLLALNAAVEAARAGEAGAGFAVVADEVRNLAIRAAEAAKNTAVLIDETLGKVKEGQVLVTSTSGAFARVAGKASKAAELVDEIAAASSEQTTGIDQMNQTLSEIDRVVQQNSASSEESASASMELSTQANKMNAFVRELAVMTGQSV